MSPELPTRNLAAPSSHAASLGNPLVKSEMSRYSSTMQGSDVQQQQQQQIHMQNRIPVAGGSMTAQQLASSNRPPSNEFVRKLFKILESNIYSNIVRWTEEGDSFVVLDTGKFTTQILPNHFKHSNFASFVRQLNKYDFHKVKRKMDDKQKPKFGELSWEFKHPAFQIHNEKALDNIKRKMAASKKMDESSFTGRMQGTGGENSTGTTISKDVFNNLKKRVEGLEKELFASKNETLGIKIEVQKMNSKYNALLESLITFKTVNENLMSSFNQLCSSLSNNAINIPQHIYQSAPGTKDGNLTAPVFKSHQGSPNNNEPNHAQSLINNPLPLIGTPSNDILLPLQTSESRNNGVETSSNRSNNNSNTTPGSNDANVADLKQIPNEFNAQVPQQGLDLNNVELRKGFHVLLVEDDAISIQLCSKFLRKYGCTVQVVTDGLSAITTLENSRYDLVLMDIVMPNLDGATATSIIRSFDNQTPIIAMTGNIDDGDLITYLQHGMNDILAKPFTRDDLHSMLIRYLKDRTPLCEQKRQLASESNVNHQQPNQPAAPQQHQHQQQQQLPQYQNEHTHPSLNQLSSQQNGPQNSPNTQLPQNQSSNLPMDRDFEDDNHISKKPRV
ncbi:kinase-regulated stress-responsive transcription factor SKN7 KNAG_0M00180 [Huiozyma naganishii CBS 8797]|uniref:Transcription factor n=1 Tax=Huiozyma naganishii (strain ATCC MYA-139 / BCRC 22969 / CBS 8797 / KCTC 17520 / NBRC 10181 / NCYC 3082 / Yp74L-3) TaxID=1071383 RepID=J7SB97_HUIN7|nr:hypothetical protein KNAG_0M00180 [Kazachstania naganishii CBS 8797]CCK72871.1 hypothetical protein KNAG_0M00180 [Kazachstania naganishii CBS 8797]